MEAMIVSPDSSAVRRSRLTTAMAAQLSSPVVGSGGSVCVGGGAFVAV